MPSTDAFALRRSGLNEFLFAAIGTEGNGMRLSVLSVFARLGHDPWKEAGRLAGLPKLEAAESLRADHRRYADQHLAAARCDGDRDLLNCVSAGAVG